MLPASLLLIINLIFPKNIDAAGTLQYTGVDVMKWTKDTMRNQPTNAEINGIVKAIMDNVRPEYISISIPMDATSAYGPNNVPAPRTAEAFTQAWSDAIHAQGAKVLWRGTWSGIEGIYDFPKQVGANRLPTGTAASAVTDGNSTWLGKTYKYIIDHPTFFQNGDIWAPLPERTEGIFSDATSFISHGGYGLQQNYAQFFIDVKAVSDTAFSAIGKNVITGLTANNFSEINSGWMYNSVLQDAGVIVVDHYGITHMPQEMDHDIRKIHSERGLPVFIQEWGDYWHPDMPEAERMEYLRQMYAVYQKLVDDGILIGFNYWGAWEGPYEGILVRSGNNFGINARGMLVAQLFGTAPAPTQSPEPAAQLEPAASEPVSSPVAQPDAQPTQQPVSAPAVAGTQSDSGNGSAPQPPIVASQPVVTADPPSATASPQGDSVSELQRISQPETAFGTNGNAMPQNTGLTLAEPTREANTAPSVETPEHGALPVVGSLSGVSTFDVTRDISIKKIAENILTKEFGKQFVREVDKEVSSVAFQVFAGAMILVVAFGFLLSRLGYAYETFVENNFPKRRRGYSMAGDWRFLR